MKKSTFWEDYGWLVILIVTIVVLAFLYYNFSTETNNSPSFSEFIPKVMEKEGIMKTLHAIMPKFTYEKQKPRKHIIVESKGERETRRALLRIFNLPFTKIRPMFLKNDETGKNLEIDAYNDKLKIGVEYNGKQHYNYTPGWHASYKDFAKMQERDELKRKRCRENGITLIEIPYTIELNNIETYLRTELKKLGKL